MSFLYVLSDAHHWFTPEVDKNATNATHRHRLRSNKPQYHFEIRVCLFFLSLLSVGLSLSIVCRLVSMTLLSTFDLHETRRTKFTYDKMNERENERKIKVEIKTKQERCFLILFNKLNWKCFFRFVRNYKLNEQKNGRVSIFEWDSCVGLDWKFSSKFAKHYRGKSHHFNPLKCLSFSLFFMTIWFSLAEYTCFHNILSPLRFFLSKSNKQYAIRLLLIAFCCCS